MEYSQKSYRDGIHRDFLHSDIQLSDYAPDEVLELLLLSAIPRGNLKPLANRLIKEFGSLNAVLSATFEELREIKGLSKSGAVTIMQIRRIINYINRANLGEKPFMRNVRDAKAFCSVLFSGTSEERFYLICLDARRRVINTVLLSIGTIDEVSVYPREVVGTAIRYNAHHIVLVHNHPSGILEPSDADIEMTERLMEAFFKVDMVLQDHIIYADGQCLSYSQWKNAKGIPSKSTPPRQRVAKIS